MISYYDNLFLETEVDWPRVKRGFERMLERYPESDSHRNFFARFALDARDAETFRKLWPDIEAAPSERVWRYADEKQRRDFFLANGYIPLVLPPDLKLDRGKDRATALAFHPAEPVLFAGDEKGVLRRFDLRNPEQEQTEDYHHAIYDLAFSPDGHFLAIGLGDFKRDKGSVLILNSSDGSVLLKSEDFAGPVRDVVFDPDNGDLIAAGGRSEEQGEVKILPMGEELWRKHQGAETRNWHYTSVIPETGSARLLSDWGNRVAALAGPDERQVELGAHLPRIVYQLVASPEGERIYVLRAPDHEKDYGDRPGIIALDRKTLKRAPWSMPPVRTGLHKGVLSADNRYLAALDTNTNLTTILDLEKNRWGVIAVESLNTVDLAFGPDDQWLAILDRKGGVQLYDWPRLLTRLPWMETTNE